MLGEDNNQKIKSISLTPTSLNDKEVMQIKGTKDFFQSYKPFTTSEKSLLYAGLCSARNINFISPFSEEEKGRGIVFKVPINDIAEMMGYDLEKEKKNKGHYRVIKKAAQGLRERTAIKEIVNDDGTRTFDVFGIVDRVLYNDNKDGMVTFYLNGGFSPYLFSDPNEGNFVLYSLIFMNKIIKDGKVGTQDLHELLYSDFYRAKSSKNGTVDVYYDYVELRAKLGFIKTGESAFQHLINDKDFSNLADINVVYKRLLALERLDEPIREEIARVTEEIRNTDPVNEELIKELKLRLKTLNDRVIAQYNEYTNFRHKVLIPAQKTFLKFIVDCPEFTEFMFEYKPKRYNKKVIGITFTIYTIDAYRRKEAESGTQMSLFELEKSKDDTPIVTAENILTTKTVGIMNEKNSGRRKKSLGKDIAINLVKLQLYIQDNPCTSYIGGEEGELNSENLYDLLRKYDYDRILNNYKLMVNTKNVVSKIKWLTSACDKDYAANSTDNGEIRNTKTVYKEMATREIDVDLIEDILINPDKYSEEDIEKFCEEGKI